MSTPPLLSLDKALSLLSLLAADAGARSALELAAEQGLPPATAHRILATFERRGFLTRVARGRYLPGPALLRQAQARSFNRVLEAAGRPLLQRLARRTGLVAHLGVFEGDMVTYLIKAGRGGGDFFTREGMQLEAYCTGIGKMLLACLSADERDRYLAGGPFVPLTAHTITDAERLRAELARIAKRGHAIDDREMVPDLYCIAAHVRDETGAAVAALSLSAHRANPRPHLAALRDTARALEQRLFPSH